MHLIEREKYQEPIDVFVIILYCFGTEIIVFSKHNG